MAGKNSQIHLFLETDLYIMVKKEAEKLKLSTGELIRRKLRNPPIDEEVLLLRRLKEVLKK